MNVTGKTIREYLSITFTSFIFGIDAFIADAPLLRAWRTFGLWTELAGNEKIGANILNLQFRLFDRNYLH